MNGRELIEDIQNGYRMTPPGYSPNLFKQMMTNCWKEDQNERPTFSQIADIVENYIESFVGMDYFNMNYSCENRGSILTHRPAIGNNVIETSLPTDVSQEM